MDRSRTKKIALESVYDRPLPIKGKPEVRRFILTPLNIVAVYWGVVVVVTVLLLNFKHRALCSPLC